MTQTADAPTQNLPARIQYQPLAPIGSASNLKSLLEAQRNGIAQTLPKHITPERVIKTFLVAVNRIPDLLRCTQASLLETINRAAELGLDLSGTLGEAYPVPFNNKTKDADGREVWVMQCTLIIGYRGLEKLAWQSGEVESIDAEVVYARDTFDFRKGTEVHVSWSPYIGPDDRGPVVGAYACVKLKSGGKLARFLPRSEIEKIRNTAKSKDSPAWRNWWDEMARKCALKRTLKDAPLSTEKLVAAIEHDNADHDLADVLAAQTTPQGRGTAALRQRLEGNQGPAPDGESQLPTEEHHTDGEPPPKSDEDQRQQTEIADALAGDWESVTRVLFDAARAYDATHSDSSIDRAAFDASLGKWVLRIGKKGSEAKISKASRLEVFEAIRGGKFDFGTGAIVKD